MTLTRLSIRRRLTQLAWCIGLFTCFAGIDLYFPVEEGTAVIVTRLGRPVRELTQPGPYWKWPTPIEQLHVLDRRRRILTIPEATSLTRDKKNIVLTSYVIWHIERPLTFLQSVGRAESAEAALGGLMLAVQTQRIGQHELSALVSTRPELLRLTEIEQETAAIAANEALERFGISIDQVGVERIAFPAENLDAVYARMRSEREAAANRLRAEGAQAAQAIRDQTHVESQEILRKGREEAARIAADAERQAAERLADAHRRNPEFYRFWSSLQAGKRLLKERSTLIVTSDQLLLDGLLKPLPQKLKEPQTPPDQSPRTTGAQP